MQLPCELWEEVAAHCRMAPLLCVARGVDWRRVAAIKIQNAWRHVRRSWDRSLLCDGDRVVLYGGRRRMYGLIVDSTSECFCVKHFSAYRFTSYYSSRTRAGRICELRLRRLDNLA